MDDKTARDMDRLLARGKLSGPEADAILDRVLDTVERKEPRQRPRVTRYYVGAALAAVAAVLLVIAVPTAEETPVLEVSCSSGPLSACSASSSLVFRVQGNRAAGFLSAYAEPLDPGGAPVFYGSKEGERLEVVAPKDRKRPTERRAPLSTSQRPGRYRVHVFFAERPLGREEMQQGTGGTHVVAASRVEIVIVE